MSRVSTSARGRRLLVLLSIAFSFALILVSPAAAATAPTSRIIHGTLVPNDPSKYPYIVALEDTSGHNFCGGTLIAPYWVVTASHCKKVDFVVYGRKSLSDTSVGEKIPVVEQIENGGFNSTTITNDLQLLRLAHAPADVHALPVATPAEEPAETSTVYLAGWGITEFSDGNVVNDLREAALTLMPHAGCAAQWGILGVGILSNQLCAAYWGAAPDGSQDRQACNGDSGGPLVGPSAGGDRLIGLTSFGRPGCNGFPYPTVYTRVSSFYSFIHSVIDGHAGFDERDISFGNVTLGSGLVQRTIGVTSTGAQPVTVTGAQMTGAADFAVLDNQCLGLTLAPGDQCNVVVTFTPTTLGAAAATLTLGSTAGTSSVSLSSLNLSTGKSLVPPTLKLVQSGKSVSKKGKLKVVVKASFIVTTGANQTVACSGNMLLTAKVPGVRKSLKTQAPLAYGIGQCTSKLTLRMPRKAKHKKVKFTLRFPGNSSMLPTQQAFKIRVK